MNDALGREGYGGARARQRMHLECWFWAIVFAATGVLVIVYRIDHAERPSTDAFIDFNQTRIDRLARDPANYKVVMFGDSRLKYATLPESELSVIAAENGVDIAYLRIIQNTAEFADFEPFLPSVLDLGPDIVLLQDHLYTRQRQSKIDYRILQKYAVWALLDGAGTWNPEGRDQAELQFGTPCERTHADLTLEQLSDLKLERRIRRAVEEGTHEPDGANARAVRDFMESARRLDVDVIALAVPNTGLLTEALRNIRAGIEPASAIRNTPGDSWVYREPIADEDFCDLVHMDVRARSGFSGWLTGMTMARLSHRDSSLRFDFESSAAAQTPGIYVDKPSK